MMKWNSITALLKGARNDAQQQHTSKKQSYIDSDAVQLTNVQCHMVLISIT